MSVNFRLPASPSSPHTSRHLSGGSAKPQERNWSTSELDTLNQHLSFTCFKKKGYNATIIEIKLDLMEFKDDYLEL